MVLDTDNFGIQKITYSTTMVCVDQNYYMGCHSDKWVCGISRWRVHEYLKKYLQTLLNSFKIMTGLVKWGRTGLDYPYVIT